MRREEQRMQRNKVMGEKLDMHCPYDESQLRASLELADHAICPVCWTAFPLANKEPHP